MNFAGSDFVSGTACSKSSGLRHDGGRAPPRPRLRDGCRHSGDEGISRTQWSCDQRAARSGNQYSVTCLWNQHRCSRVAGKTSRTAFQNPRTPSPTGQHRGGHSAAAAIAQQISPRLGEFPKPVSEGDKFFAAIGTHPDHHQPEPVHRRAPEGGAGRAQQPAPPCAWRPQSRRAIHRTASLTRSSTVATMTRTRLTAQ